MYGKLYRSTFTGSMVGAGTDVIATWAYIVAHTNLDSTIEINPILLAASLGCESARVEKALEFLSSPDPKSRTPTAEGRRLLRVGQFMYQVVNFDHYNGLKSDNQRRDYMRDYMAKRRSKGPVLTEKLGLHEANSKHALVSTDTDSDSEPLLGSEITTQIQPHRDPYLATPGRGAPSRIPEQPEPPHKPPNVPRGTVGLREAAIAQTIERCRSAYPAGLYRDQEWLTASHSIGALLDQGTNPDLLIAGATGYHAQQEALAKLGTQYVLGPAKFFGSNHWRGPFKLPAKPPERETAMDEIRRVNGLQPGGPTLVETLQRNIAAAAANKGAAPVAAPLGAVRR